MSSNTVAVLTSGGVDSSLALVLLKNQGLDVRAYYLKIWLEDELSYLGSCPWEEDLEYVRSLCDQLGVPLEIIPLQKEYHERVISYALSEIKAGRTPNPDIWCNSTVKFAAFFEALVSKNKPPQSPLSGGRSGTPSSPLDSSVILESEYSSESGIHPIEVLTVATGHYAQVEEKNGNYYLKKAPDPIKDQTYFLARLTQAQLRRAMFPIGFYTKEEVRKLAQDYDIPAKDRKDSQGLCFLGKIPFREFIAHHMGTKQGDIIDVETGKVLGQHDGYWFVTIGQRHGLGLGGGPWFVVKKDIEKNIVYIAHQDRLDTYLKDMVNVTDMHWIAGLPKDLNNLTVKIRHGRQEYVCAIDNPNSDMTEFTLKLDTADKGISPGQYAVIYQGDYCLGGGVIV